LKILLTTAHPFLPEMAGGMQMSGDTLARGLIARGHEVAVFSGLTGRDLHGLWARIRMKLTGVKVVSDMRLGYRIWRSWFPWETAAYVAKKMQPDVVVVMARKPVRVAGAFQAAKIPVLMWLQDVEFIDHEGDFNTLGSVPCVANSHFTADTYRHAFKVDPKVVYPIVKGSKYATQSSREVVTLINPHPKKGLNVALEMAALCPDIPFLFVQTWPLNDAERTDLDRKLAKLPNITLHPTVQDMKQIYGRTKVLLAPSQWQEGFGRIATEAHYSGIPVLASRRGGLPEAVGPGGILLEADAPGAEWAAALRRLWSDKAYYAELSAAATAHSQRPANDPDQQVAQWEKALAEVVQKRSAQ